MQRKLLLVTVSSLAIGCASAAFAGSSSTFLNQTGSTQNATIDQTGGNQDFVGTSNASPFVQQNGAGTGGNVITITQTGSNNSATGQGQSGTTNNATISQSGTHGSVALSQTGTNNGQGTFGSPAVDGGTVDQGAGNNQFVTILQQQSNNQFNISQQGNNSVLAFENKVGIEQDASNNTALISQNGSGLSVSIRQDAPGHGAGFNGVTSTQTGLGNSLVTLQENSAGSASSMNTISSIQSASAGVYPNGADTANITQNGTMLTVTNNQSGTHDNALTVTAQTGTSNNISNTQSGNNNGLTVTSQSSSGNHINSTQSGSFNTAMVTSQSGSNGHINNTQSGTNGSATYSQAGSMNVATLQDQTGSWNKASVEQDSGLSNSLVQILQNGNGTSSASTQQNSVSMTQTDGSGNLAFLVQGGAFSGLSTSTLLISGGVGGEVSGNAITGTQGGGDSNYAAVSQQSNGNVATFNQSGSTNHASIKQ